MVKEYPLEFSKGGAGWLGLINIDLYLETYRGGGCVEHVHDVYGDASQSLLKPVEKGSSLYLKNTELGLSS